MTTSDQLPDDARRRQGAFFTPRLWAAEAHKSLDKVLGVGWRDECIVWDPAAGTANLTRDYRFDDLIISTAEKPDVRVIEEQGYNAGASVFQYDFLNPGFASPFFDTGDKNLIPDSVHKQLKAAAKAGRRLVFLMNPPYGTAKGGSTKEGAHKAGIAKTLVNEQMKKAKLGSPSQQLYAQFMYQCCTLAQRYGFKAHTVALFSPSKFMCSGSYRNFRLWWYGRYEVKDAFMFQASHFADVNGSWGISHTIWNSPGKTNLSAPVPCTLKDEPKGTFAVTDIGPKALYNSDNREASKWVREPIKGRKGVDAPQSSSGLKVKGKGRGSISQGAMGYMQSNGNSIQYNTQFVALYPSAFSGANGFSVRGTTGGNFRRAIALYGARKLVKDHWTIHEDEYLVPHAEGTPVYEQWINDCHVYAILHNSNNCTAMRNVAYKDGPPNGSKDWQIHNHFFWLDHADALAALDTTDTPALYRDCKQHPSKDVFGNPVVSTPDPYMAHALRYKVDLSNEAKAVLDKLQALWLLSLPHRENYAAGKPELHLTAWDASVYQLKFLWRDLFPTEWADLQVAFKILSAKIRPGVYEHGFLLK